MIPTDEHGKTYIAMATCEQLYDDGSHCARGLIFINKDNFRFEESEYQTNL